MGKLLPDVSRPAWASRGDAMLPEMLDFAVDDPYLTEDAAFVDAVRRGDGSPIRSSYADAMKTYELTWAIRRRAENRKV